MDGTGGRRGGGSTGGRATGAAVLAAVALVTGLAGLAAPASAGQPLGPSSASTATTGWHPMAKIPGNVEVKCTFTIHTNGTMSTRCQFRNNDAQPHKFAYCTMLDTAGGIWSVSGVTGENYAAFVNRSKSPPSVECEKTGSRSGVTDVHFGCKMVDLPANGTATVDFGFTEDPFEDSRNRNGPLRAWDFEVNYADYLLLDPSQNYQFDYQASGCADAKGQADYVFPNGSAGAAWVVHHQPMWIWIPPFWQPRIPDFEIPDLAVPDRGWYPGALDGPPPCVPPNFPAEGVDLPRCPDARQGLPPPPQADLNLFWYESVHGDGGPFEIRLEGELSGDTEGIRLETEPPLDEPVTVEQGERRVGDIRLCEAGVTEECRFPDVDRGDRVQVRLTAVNAETGEVEFGEGVTFVNDTRPPKVTDLEASTPENGTLSVEVTAEDATTNPLFANLWYLPANGTWQATAMDAPDAGPFDERPTRTFAATVDDLPGGEVEYFVEVADRVANLNYFGVETEEVSAPSNVPLHPLPALAALAAGALALGRRRRDR